MEKNFDFRKKPNLMSFRFGFIYTDRVSRIGFGEKQVDCSFLKVYVSASFFKIIGRS